MITDRIDPPELLKIPEVANITVAEGTRIIHVSGQTSVDTKGQVVGATHHEQARNASLLLKTALAAAGATPADIAKLTVFVVDYSWEALEAIIKGSQEAWGDEFPV